MYLLLVLHLQIALDFKFMLLYHVLLEFIHLLVFLQNCLYEVIEVLRLLLRSLLLLLDQLDASFLDVRYSCVSFLKDMIYLPLLRLL